MERTICVRGEHVLLGTTPLSSRLDMVITEGRSQFFVCHGHLGGVSIWHVMAPVLLHGHGAEFYESLTHCCSQLLQDRRELPVNLLRIVEAGDPRNFFKRQILFE